MRDSIFVKGAREHNLKNINVAMPRNKLIVITGLSGSGKSTLAFDTIYAEGQRRYTAEGQNQAKSYEEGFMAHGGRPRDVGYNRVAS